MLNPYQYNPISTRTKPGASTWTDSGRYDIAWYSNNPDATEFHIDTEQELAGLAYLVNNGNTFAGKTVYLDADLNMDWYHWVPIGFGSPFCGTFDGQGYTISGLYYNNTAGENIGLFGVLRGSADSYACVKNLVVDDAYFKGDEEVGAIAGFVYRYVVIDNCVVGSGVLVSGNYGVGGLIGDMNYGNMYVYNCVNYGTIFAKQGGGIVGTAEVTEISNNANYGRVTVSSNALGGISAIHWSGEMNNNFSVGRLTCTQNTTSWIGSLIGQAADEGSGSNNFYLWGAATNNTGTIPLAAFGGNGAASDATGNYTAAKITTPEELLAALNAYVEENGDGKLSKWEMGPKGYPVPVGSPVSAVLP